MALVNIININVLDNPSPFRNPLQFEITFECLQALDDDLEWKVIYVGSAEDSSYDQVLEEVLVGPVPVGMNRFVLQSDAPDPSRIPTQNDTNPTDEGGALSSGPHHGILGVTVVLVTCSYKEQEFVRIGYYVNNYIPQEEEGEGQQLEEEQRKPVDATRVVRQILAEKPRVTRFPIDWGGDASGDTQQTAEEDQEALPATTEDAQDDDDVIVTSEDDDEDENEERRRGDDMEDVQDVEMMEESEEDDDDGDKEIDIEESDQEDEGDGVEQLITPETAPVQVTGSVVPALE